MNLVTDIASILTATPTIAAPVMSPVKKMKFAIKENASKIQRLNAMFQKLIAMEVASIR